MHGWCVKDLEDENGSVSQAWVSESSNVTFKQSDAGPGVRWGPILYLRPRGKRDNEAETERDLRTWAELFLEVKFINN